MDEDKPETSIQGAKRMRHLLSAPHLGTPSTAAIHHPSGRLIYRHPQPISLSSTTTTQPTPPRPGHLYTSFLPSSVPRPLPTPPFLTPGTHLFTCPSSDLGGGDPARWTVIFHPNPPMPGQQSEGGTLGIYDTSALLVPGTIPEGVIPLATFPLPQDPLAFQALYLPRACIGDGSLTAGHGGGGVENNAEGEGKAERQGEGEKSGEPFRRAPPMGPVPPRTYISGSSTGPTFLLLLPSCLILIHPQIPLGDPPTEQAGGQIPLMALLRCPLTTRWSARASGEMPPDTGARAGRGWMGVVPGDEGVWVGWEGKGRRGVARADVSYSGGEVCLAITPMPSLPTSIAPPWPVAAGPASAAGETESAADSYSSETKTELQGMMFIRVPSALVPDAAAGAVKREDGRTLSQKEMVVVGAALVYRDTYLPRPSESESGRCRTRIEVLGFQRIEVELADGFDEISSNVDPEGITRSWDWFTMPHPIYTTLSPPDTTVLALTPLAHVPPHTFALALLCIGNTVSLAHIDLAPADGAEWKLIGRGVQIDMAASPNVQLVPSQAVERGLGGIVALAQPGEAVKLVALGRIDREARDGDKGCPAGAGDAGSRAGKDIAAGVLVAVKEGYSPWDVLRAGLSNVQKTQQSVLVESVLQRAFPLFEADLDLDELTELCRLQIALFTSVNDARRTLARDIVRLIGVSRLINDCRMPTSGGAIDGQNHDRRERAAGAWNPDAIWGLIPAIEWATTILALLFRDVIHAKAVSEWSSTAASSLAMSSSRSYVLAVPRIRRLIILVLDQVRAFKAFVETTEMPILQAPSRFLPMGTIRDPRATILARERVRDLEIRSGLNVSEWITALAGVENTSQAKESAEMGEAMITLRPPKDLAQLQRILDPLPCPSSLILAELDPEEEYDGVTFEPLAASSSVTGAATHRLDASSGEAAAAATATATRTEIRCDTCRIATVSLGSDVPPHPVGDEVRNRNAWNEYRREREKGCLCGGNWIRVVCRPHQVA